MSVVTWGPDADLLAGAHWECASSPAGGGGPSPPDVGWIRAAVPGTAAAAVRGSGDPGALLRDYDAEDWWFRCTFSAPPSAGPYTLALGGLATIADVYLNGEHLLHSEDMFVAHEVSVAAVTADNELLVRCAALAPRLAVRRPRPRWKSPDLVHQNLRWFRTSLLGRQTGGVAAPAPVGPWRPVTLTAPPSPAVRRRRLVATYAVGRGGRLEVEVEVEASGQSQPASVEVAGASAPMTLARSGAAVVGRAVLELPEVEAWWPHTHGGQPLYDVTVHVGQARVSLGRVGFRSVEVDRSAGAFTLSVNEVAVFCRGVCWSPPDPVSLTVPSEDLRRALTRIRDANLNLVRVTGIGVYESREFLDLCDELGVLLWQDCMFAFYDAPDDDAFRDQVSAELGQVFASLQGRPSLAVVCGGSENEQQAAYLGLPPDRWASPLAQDLIPSLVDKMLPGTVWVRNSPGESPLPSMVNQGPGHYFAVGAYLRPLQDARRANVRFASECLAFANPPELLDTVEGNAAARGIGHSPAWKSVIHRDANTAWDLEDVRDWYTRTLFGVDPTELRRLQPDRAHLLARATVATVFESTLSEWRRPGSTCAGAVILQAHDVGFGGGHGIVDGLGRPKSSWYVIRRLMRPTALSWSDEGVNGLALYVVSDDPERWTATVRVDALIDGEFVGNSATVDVEVVGGGAIIETATLFGGFRDLGHAHKFGPPAYDVLVATLADEQGKDRAQAVHLPGQTLRPVEPDLGLRAVLDLGEETPRVTLSTRRVAQWISFDLVGWYAQDSWFHLLPGDPVTVELVPTGRGSAPPRGSVVAVNSARSQPFDVLR